MDCRLVLVEPHFSGNIGAAARVMRNFGMSDLVLVRPMADPLDRQALRLSTHGEAILRSARIVSDLGDALADRHLVVGTSARTGGLIRGRGLGIPSEILPRFQADLAAGNKGALVFGPETNGLTNADIARCHYLVRIPTAADYPALNLAQAVAICLYELHRVEAPPAVEDLPTPLPEESRASVAEMGRMFENLESALRDIRFLQGAKAEALMHALRHLIARAGPSSMEVRLLHGLARQLSWFSRQGSGE